MPKSNKFLKIIAIASMAIPLISCDNSNAVKVVEEDEKEISLNASLSSATFKYDGKSHSLSIVGELPENVYVVYTGNNQTEVGDYNVIANFKNSIDTSKKYKSVSATMHIIDDLDNNDFSNKLANVVFPDQTVTYTGSAVTLMVSNLPSGYSVTFSNNDDGRGYINVGTYIVYATISDQTGAKVFNKSAILTILPKDTVLQNVRFNSRTYVYNGVARSLEVEGNLPAYLSVQYSNNNQVDAGIYTVTATFISSDPNIKAPSPMYATLRIVDELAHTVTFVDENDKVLSTIPNVIDGTTLSDESVPNYLSDYPSAYEKHYDTSLISNIRDDVTVKVTYSLREFKLSYIVPHGVKNDSNPNSYTFEDSITLEEPIIDKGYYFVGYYEDSAYTKPLNSIAVRSVGDKTIYSKVEVIPESGVIFKNVYKEYDGNPADVKPTGNVLDTDKYSITYYDTLGNKLNSAPINAGVYSMVMEYSRISAINPDRYDRLNDFVATLIINKKTSDEDSIQIDYNAGVKYENGKYEREYSEDDGVRLTINNLPNYLSYQIKYYTADNVLLPSYPQNAGYYYAKISFTADNNHIAPSNMIENIYIKKQTIKLTDDEKKAVFSDTTFKYEKGTTFTLSADLNKLPEKYKSIISIERYLNNQSASICSKTATVYLNVVNDNYALDESCKQIEATLRVEDNEKLRNIKYIFDGHEIKYRDSNANKVDTSIKYEYNQIAPELNITEYMFTSGVSLIDDSGHSYDFLYKKGYRYGWTKLTWKLSTDINGTNTIENNVIPSGGNTNTTYYMILTAEKISITVNYYKSNLASTTPNSILVSQGEIKDLTAPTAASGYKFDYYYTDPKNPSGSQISSIDASNYFATKTPTIMVYPMFSPSLTTDCYNVHYKYKDTDGSIKTYKFTNNADSFKVPYGSKIPVLADIEAEGYTFSNWYIQTSSTGTDINTPSKLLTSDYILNRPSSGTSKDIYIYGELISKTYDIVINFPGEDSFIIKIGYKGSISSTAKNNLKSKLENYLKKHPEYNNSTLKATFKDNYGSNIDILSDNYRFYNTTDLVLGASFEKVTYYTKFAGIDGLDIYNNQNNGRGILQTEDSLFILPTIKEKDGYTFKKWRLTAAKGNFNPIEVYSSSTVNLADIYNYETNGQLTLTAVYEENTYSVVFVTNDGVNSPTTEKMKYMSSNFYLSDDGTKIISNNDDGSTKVVFSAPTRKGYKFLGFYFGEYELSAYLNLLNEYIDKDSSLSINDKTRLKRLFKFDSNIVISTKYEKTTYSIRFYDNRRHIIDTSKIGTADDNYIHELDNYYVVNYDDLFALPSNVTFKGIEGYKIEGYYLEYLDDETLAPADRVKNKIIDITRCSDSGNFKPTESTILLDNGNQVINVYINLVPQTYYITLIEDTYTAKDTLHDGINRTYKTKTVEVKYGQNIKDIVVDSYTISDGKGGYITKEIKLIDELPIKAGYDFDGWITSTSYDPTTLQYVNHLIFNYQRDENNKYVLDENKNKIRIITDGDGNEITYDYNYNITLVANYAGRVLNANYKYEVENAGMTNGRYNGLTLEGSIDMDDILDSLKDTDDSDSKDTISTGLNKGFDGTLDYGEIAQPYTILDAWIKRYIQEKNPDNRSLDNFYVGTWYYVRYDDYNEVTGEYETQTRIQITSSTNIRSTDKVDFICVLTCPTAPVTFFDSTTNTNLTKPSTIHSNVPLMLKMTMDYKRDSQGNLTTEVGAYNYQLIELADISEGDKPDYSQALGSIRAEFTIQATTSSSAYTFDGISFKLTFGNEQPEGTPSSITLNKVYTSSNDVVYQFIFEPTYEIDDLGNKTKLINNYISNPGSVVFTPSYVPRNNVRIAFYTSNDINANNLFDSMYISSGGTYTIPSATPTGSKGQIFAGWVRRGGDSSSLIKSGTFKADVGVAEIVYYAKYEYSNIRISYRVGSETVLVKQSYDGEATSSQMYDKNEISKTSIVIGGYEFNGHESYSYNPVSGIGNPTAAGCVYNHYKITKWKVIDDEGNLVYTNGAYVTSGQKIYLSVLLNNTATNVYIVPADDGMEYVGVTLSYSVNNVSYGPFVVDKDVYFSPLEILKENSFLYQHGLRTVYSSNYTTDTRSYSGKQVAIDSKKLTSGISSVVLTGVYAYDESDGVLKFDNQGMISEFNPTISDEKRNIWSSVVLPGYYFSRDEQGSITNYRIVSGIKSVTDISESVFGKVDNADNNFKIKAVSFPTVSSSSDVRGYNTIGDYAFANCKGLTTITFSSNTTTIGKFAFANCTSLQAIECPSNLTTIQAGAFLNTTKLRTVTFNKKLNRIMQGAFALSNFNGVNPTGKCGDDNLTELKFPLSLTTIGDYAFTSRGSLKSITWEDVNRSTKEYGNDIDIGAYAFAIAIETKVDPKASSSSIFTRVTKENTQGDSEYDDSLPDTDVALSKATTMYELINKRLNASTGNTLNDVDLEYEAALKISFPRGLNSIGEGAFKYRVNFSGSSSNSGYGVEFYNFQADIDSGYLTANDIKFLPKLTIEADAFRVKEDKASRNDLINNGYLTRTFNSKYFQVVDKAFRHISLPINLKSIGNYAFAYRSIPITNNGNTNDTYHTFNDTVFITDTKSNLSYTYRDLLSDLTIGDCAFIGNRTINYSQAKQGRNGITIPYRTKSIGNYAFYNNTSYTLVYNANDATSVDESKFRTTKIGDYAFAVSYALYDILDSDTKAKYSKYPYVMKNNKVKYSSLANDNGDFDSNKNFAYSLANLDMANIKPSNPVQCSYYDTNAKIVFSSELATIGKGAFMFNLKFNEIVFTKSSETIDSRHIGDHAFDGCYFLKSITNDLEQSNIIQYSIGKYAFRNCQMLNSNGTNNVITLPSSLDYVPEGIFAGCENLENVNLTKIASGSTFSIYDYAFYHCYSLKTVDNNSNSISLTKVETIGSFAFDECRSLDTVVLSSKYLTTEEGVTANNNNVSKLNTMELPYIGGFEDDNKQIFDYNLASLDFYSFEMHTNAYAAINNATLNSRDEWNTGTDFRWNDNPSSGTKTKNASIYPNSVLDWEAFYKLYNEYVSKSVDGLDSATALSYNMFSHSELIRTLLVNYTFKNSPIGTRAFYVGYDYPVSVIKGVNNLSLTRSKVSITDCKIMFDGTNTKNINVISPYALARNKALLYNYSDQSKKISIASMFPYLIDGGKSTGSGRGTDGQSGTYQEYLEGGDETLGYHGIIGSFAFYMSRKNQDEEIVYTNDENGRVISNYFVTLFDPCENGAFVKSGYLRTKYILPFGLAGVAFSTIYLNRIGDDGSKQTLDSNRNVNYSEHYHSQGIPESNQRMQQRAVSGVSWIDLKYTVTPFMFAGALASCHSEYDPSTYSTYNSNSDPSYYGIVYLDGQINEYGFSLLQDVRVGGLGDLCRLKIGTASGEFGGMVNENYYLWDDWSNSGACKTYSHSFNHDTAFPSKNLNYLDLTGERQKDNQRRGRGKDYGFEGWGDGYRVGFTCSYGVTGVVDMYSSFYKTLPVGQLALSAYADVVNYNMDNNVCLPYGKVVTRTSGNHFRLCYTLGDRQFFENGYHASALAILGNNFKKTQAYRTNTPIRLFNFTGSSCVSSSNPVSDLYSQNSNGLYNLVLSSSLHSMKLDGGKSKYLTIGNVMTSSRESYNSFSSSLIGFAALGIFGLATFTVFINNNSAGFGTSTANNNHSSDYKNFTFYNAIGNYYCYANSSDNSTSKRKTDELATMYY